MTTLETNGMEKAGVSVDLRTEGPEDKAEKVHIHAKAAVVEALQAFDTGQHPDECDGPLVSVNWDAVMEDYDGGGDE